MDKAKANLMVIITVSAIICVVLIGYAASLNSQLGASKTKVMQLNDQIAGLNDKANGLQTQLTSLTVQANDQTNLASNLQKSLNAVNTELNSLKIAYADLEAKLKAQISAGTLQPLVSEAIPVK